MILAGETTDVFGRKLEIDPIGYKFGEIVSVDVETDEKDGFVGLSTYDGSDRVYYFTRLSSELSTALSQVKLLAHNAKFDARMLIKWGVPIKSEHLYFDTMLAHYSIDCGADTHALKPLAECYLGYKWSTYKEMTQEKHVERLIHRFKMEKDETGRRHRVTLAEPQIEIKEHITKHTLDTQPIEKVAHYCASDAVATWDLMRYLERKMTPEAKWVFLHLEMPVLRITFDMEQRGIRIDRDKLQRLHTQFTDEMNGIAGKVKETIGVQININSSKQLAPHLERFGMTLPVTDKGNKKTSKDVLQQYAGQNPLADLLIEYSQVKKLVTAFTAPLLERGDRIHPSYNQVVRESEHEENAWGGIATGRLSCSNPNLQQIPRRSTRGKLLRELFVPEDGETLVCADFSQIEPRILAHMSRDGYLIDVFRTNKDVYASLVAGTKLTRDDGKTFYLALVYMAQPKKLAKVFKCSVEEAEGIFKKCWANVPQVKKWQQACITYGTQLGGVRTLFKRFRSLPNLKSRDWKERAGSERRAVNTPIQGSAADIMKLAMIKLTEAGYQIRLVVHDEVLVSVPSIDAEKHCETIRSIMQDVTKLLVPIKVDAHVGASWGEAKSAS